MIYTLTDILIYNILLYSLISFIALDLGFITGVHRKIGYIAIVSTIALTTYIVIVNIFTFINNPHPISISIVDGNNPIIMYVGSFFAGMTIDYWFGVGKKVGGRIDRRISEMFIKAGYNYDL